MRESCSRKSKSPQYKKARVTFPKKIEGVMVTDELNIYLVANHLKPATEFMLSIRGFWHPQAKLEESDVKKFCNLLKQLGLHYSGQTYQVCQPPGEKPKPGLPLKDKTLLTLPTNVRIKCIEIYIGKTKKDLEDLEKAQTAAEFGKAYGFPKEAIASYNKKVKGIVRDGIYQIVKETEAKRAGIKVPSWLYYISHVPEELDIINNHISKSSEALGKKYERFVKEHNPSLARRLEKFIEENKSKPDSWTLGKDGRYRMHFKKISKAEKEFSLKEIVQNEHSPSGYLCLYITHINKLHHIMKDAIICIGTGLDSCGLLKDNCKDRVGRAMDMYKDGISSRIIFSSCSAYSHRDKHKKSEAELMKTYAMRAGIPENAIFLEEKPTNLLGSAYYTKKDFFEPAHGRNGKLRLWRSAIVVVSDRDCVKASMIFSHIFGPGYEIITSVVPTRSLKGKEFKLSDEEEKDIRRLANVLEKIESKKEAKLKALISKVKS